MPICKDCKQAKPETEFYVYKKRGRLFSECKPCWKKKVAERVQTLDPEEVRKYKRAYEKRPQSRATKAKYRASEKGREVVAKAHKKYHTQQPEKRAATIILNNAIKLGKVVKPKLCSACGASGKIFGHHHDYTKPIDVTWLCHSCHVAVHYHTAP